MTFASLFDEHLARRGPPALFVRDVDGWWRSSADLSRDGWTRGELLLERPGEPVHALVRDRPTGIVTWFYATHPALLANHPRWDVVFCHDAADAEARLARLGRPPRAASLEALGEGA